MKVTKKCTACGKEKSLDQFRKQSKNKDGLKYVCIACDDAKQKARYNKQRADYIEKVKEWQVSNPSKVKQYQQKYHERKNKPN